MTGLDTAPLHAEGGGVYTIDTGFQRPAFDAAYLVVDQGEAAFIDSGTSLSVPRLLAALDHLGLGRSQVRWIIPTHVHLDHAGGVGELLSHLPQAQVVVHPKGLRHLVEPQMLWSGATAIYGDDEMRRSYSHVRPVPHTRIQASHDGELLPLGQRHLTLIDTPGHARHHHCVWDPVTRGWFTGDTFGISYRELDVQGKAWILPSSTPVQFDPVALAASWQRLLAMQPQCVYLTHYGRLGDVTQLAAQQSDLLAEVVRLGEMCQSLDTPEAALQQGLAQIYLRSLRAHGHMDSDERLLDALAVDIQLNSQGMAVWLKTR
ncbi:MAG: MBL fold metallo-hydrolase [Ideonella sp.]|nr:MBL fold metallo-hydrolase [Ideonella sp.]